jgi:flagellar FliL protein
VSSNAPAAEPAKKPAKSKKLIIILAAVVLLLVVAGSAAAWFLSQRKAAATAEDGEAVAEHSAPAVAPTFLPMETMVVNLADDGGERFAQIGITLELADSKTGDKIKQFMPSIRSSILMLVSERTSTELLQREGKEKLAADILREVSRPLGFDVPAVAKDANAPGEHKEEAGARRSKADTKDAANPIHRVHFPSFIIQ